MHFRSDLSDLIQPKICDEFYFVWVTAKVFIGDSSQLSPFPATTLYSTQTDSAGNTVSQQTITRWRGNDLRRKTEDRLFADKLLRKVDVAIKLRKTLHLDANLSAEYIHVTLCSLHVQSDAITTV